MLLKNILATTIVAVSAVNAVSVEFKNDCSKEVSLYDNSMTEIISSGSSTSRTISNGFKGMYRDGSDDQATLVEITMDGDHPWYDLSIIPPGSDTCRSLGACKSATGTVGFNTPIQIEPQDNNGVNTCRTLMCLSDGCTDAYHFPSDIKTHDCPSGTSFLVTFCPRGSGGNSKPEPTEAPAPEPTEAPAPEPTEEPSPEPTETPSPEPTETPSSKPTKEPSPEPSKMPAPTETPKTEQTSSSEPLKAPASRLASSKTTEVSTTDTLASTQESKSSESTETEDASKDASVAQEMDTQSIQKKLRTVDSTSASGSASVSASGSDEAVMDVSESEDNSVASVSGVVDNGPRNGVNQANTSSSGMSGSTTAIIVVVVGAASIAAATVFIVVMRRKKQQLDEEQKSPQVQEVSPAYLEANF